MNDTSFPFQPDEGTPVDEASEGTSRSRGVVLGGLLGVLVLGAGGFFVLGPGGGDEQELGSPLGNRPAAVAPPVAAPAPVEVVPASTTEVVGRNPFKPRYVQPAAASAGTTTEGTPAAGTASGATSGGTSTTGTSGTGAPGGGGSTSASKSGGTAAPAEQPKEAPKMVEVREVNQRLNQVTFRVFDTSKDDAEGNSPFEDVVVKPGETFATYFKLFGYGSVLDANGQSRSCTDLLYGDARLKLCVGESYQVS